MGKLSWQLTCSYVLVTLIAALTIEITTTLIPALQEVQRGRTDDTAIVDKQDINRFASYLQQPMPNADALRYWIAVPAFDRVRRIQPSLSFVAIANTRGRILTSTACGTDVLLSTSTLHCPAAADAQADALLKLPQTTSYIQRSLQENTTMSPGTEWLPGGKSLRVEPLVSNGKQPVGALVFVIQGTFPPQQPTDTFWLRFMPALQDYLHPEGLYFVLLASALGTLIGLSFSHSLTCRLGRITHAANAWSRGNFTVEVEDRGADEIGQLTRDLNRMAEQVQFLLTSRQALAVLEERNRLARDLHDSVKQQVFSNALLVRSARNLLEQNPQKASRHLQDAEQIAEHIQQELIELISALRPAAIANLGLVSAIRAYLDDWSNRTGITIDLRVQHEQPLPLDKEVALYRVLQEALANVARHSQARQVVVDLLWEHEQVCLSVSDNGKGFLVSQISSKGVGLASMQERMTLLAGTLTVKSSEQGTLIVATVPVSHLQIEQTERKEEVQYG